MGKAVSFTLNEITLLRAVVKAHCEAQQTDPQPVEKALLIKLESALEARYRHTSKAAN